MAFFVNANIFYCAYTIWAALYIYIIIHTYEYAHFI